MVKEAFQPEEALMILNIPLSRYSEPDRLIWSDSELGLFSIKSVYFKARMILGKDSNPLDERDQLWNVVWKAQVILKVKMFMWRLIQNIIPSASYLRGKGVQLDDTCCVCRQHRESSFHVIFACTLSQDVWNKVRPKMSSFIQEHSEQSNF